MNKNDYLFLEARLCSVFDNFAPQLSDEARQNVEHYIEVAELEMACESLVLSVIEEHIQLSADIKEELLRLCCALHLDEEAVFRADFWKIVRPLLVDHD
jgi:hypothetical protein